MKRFSKLILLCALPSVILTACGKNVEAGKMPDKTVHNVYLVTPEVTGGNGTTTFPATLEEARTISVGFKTGGQIKRVLVKEGDRVAAGQLLAVLDTVDYALGVRQLKVQLEQMRSEYERQKQLFAAGNMSPNDFEKATAGLRQLELNLRLNQNKLDYCRLYAPASGVITRRNHEISEMVDAGMAVFELMDNSHLEAVVDLPVSAYANREHFRGFSGTSPLFPGQTIPLTMLSLTPRADNTQLYRLKLVVGKTPAHITAGQNITVEILTDCEIAGATDTETSAITAQVPLSAVLERDGKPGVWAYSRADSTVTFTPVTLAGTGEGGNVTVTSGLQPGMSIVRAGVHHLTDGEKVNVITDEASTNPGNVI